MFQVSFALRFYFENRILRGINLIYSLLRYVEGEGEDFIGTLNRIFTDR